ncbi:MAG TPA: hypothetical protein VFH27_18020, partial [Longimicrobiaceae bacterium]|nr:hypothetical protein [Longimicrobiaceae bacterium]
MPNPIQRLRYFDHQLLGVPEFADEQQYHMDMRRLHNRLLHTWGIADGLEVHYSAANQRLTVEEGTALDAAGREIVLQQQRDLDLAAFDGQTVWVTLAYGEVQTAPVTDGQATDYGRWEEAPRLELSATRPADSGQQLVLGRVHVNAAGESRVDDGEGSYRRRQAGSKAGDIEVRAITLSGSSDPEGWPSLRMTEAKAAAISGALTVEGALAATGDLDVQGNATVAQSVGIGGKPQARLHVQTPPQEAGANAVLVGPAEGTSLRLGYNVGYGWIQSRDGGLRVNDQGGDVLLVPGAGGSVGIGTTQPLQRLHVVGDDAVGLFESRGSAASLSLGTREGEANRAGIAARPGGRLALWTQAGDDVVNVTRDGRVGMGTENPTHRFHVRADDPVALFESIGAQAYLRIATREGMESRVEVANRPGGRLALWTAGGGDALSITREGSVSIGTDHPGARLHVAGDLVVDGVIRSAAGTSVGGGGGGAQWGGAGPWQPVNAGLGFAGSVGIGTLTPEARLQVIDAPQGSGGNTLILGPTGGSNLRLGYNTEYSWIQSHGSKPLRINELGNDVVIAAGANANVGIGT